MKSDLLDENNPDWVPSQHLTKVEDFSVLPDVAENVKTENESEYQDAEGVDEVMKLEQNDQQTQRTVATQTDASITGASTNLFLSYEQKIHLLEEELFKFKIKLEKF